MSFVAKRDAVAVSAPQVIVAKYPSWAVRETTRAVMLSLTTFSVLAVWHLHRA